MKTPRGIIAAFAVLATLPAAVAFGEPTGVVSAPAYEDGYTVLSVEIPAPVGAVRAILEDPLYPLKLSPVVKEVELLDQGSCARTALRAKSFMVSLRYEMERCPTADGWKEELIASEQVSSYDTAWTVTPIDGGTRVEVRTRIQLMVSLPDGLLSRSLARQMTESLRRLTALAQGLEP